MIKIRMHPLALDELRECEFGSYEDHIQGKNRTAPYDKGRLHIVELINRTNNKSVVTLDNAEECDEFFVQACTGTFGLYHPGVCLRIWDTLAAHVSEKTRNRISRNSIGY